jgi:hypothetical protein
MIIRKIGGRRVANDTLIFNWVWAGGAGGDSYALQASNADTYMVGVSASGVQGVRRGSVAISGKKYFELENTRSEDGGNRCGWGVANSSHSGNMGATANAVAVTGTISGGALTSTVVRLNTVDLFTGLPDIPVFGVIMGAVDSDTGKVWLGADGTWYNSGDPAAGTGEVATLSGTLYPAYGGQVSSWCRGFRYKQNYPTPTGFTAL